MSTADVKEVVREKYGQAAMRVKSGDGSPCCCADTSAGSYDPITSNLYDPAQEGEVPETAIKASLGCGNPTALAELKPGEIVLDLGSGGGVDVLLSARRVGPTGRRGRARPRRHTSWRRRSPRAADRSRSGSWDLRVGGGRGGGAGRAGPHRHMATRAYAPLQDAGTVAGS